VGGGGLLAPFAADAATTTHSARLVVGMPTSTVRYAFSAVGIKPVGGTPPTSWHIVLVTRSVTVQTKVEALYQSFIAGQTALIPPPLYKGQLLLYTNGVLAAKYAYAGGFPAAVTLSEVSALDTLQTRLLWVVRSLRKVS
jgi:hypothetical protein